MRIIATNNEPPATKKRKRTPHIGPGSSSEYPMPKASKKTMMLAIIHFVLLFTADFVAKIYYKIMRQLASFLDD